MNASYFDQFNINNLLYINTNEAIFSISNLTLIICTIILIWVCTRENNIIPSRNTIIIQNIWTISTNLTNEHTHTNHLTYEPLIFTIFIILSTINLTGLLPYVFTPTAHIIITFSLSLTIIINTTTSSIIAHNSKFFSIFTPNNCPIILAPFLVLIEITSYLTRAVSLGVRLAANISAGHLLLTILSNFTFNILLTSNLLLSCIPLTALLFISVLEIMVAIIQAYVFTLLTTIYISDTTNLH